MACSGAPSGKGTDFEVNSGGKQQREPTSSDEASDSTTDEDAADDEEPVLDGGTTTPAPSTATVTLDGVPMTVTAMEIQQGSFSAGQYNMFIRFEGPGAPKTSDVYVTGKVTGTGCVPDGAVPEGNMLVVRLKAVEGKGWSTFSPKLSAPDPACGLTVSEVPTSVGARFTGSFSGKLTKSDGAQTKTVEVRFDVRRTE